MSSLSLLICFVFLGVFPWFAHAFQLKLKKLVLQPVQQIFDSCLAALKPPRPPRDACVPLSASCLPDVRDHMGQAMARRRRPRPRGGGCPPAWAYICPDPAPVPSGVVRCPQVSASRSTYFPCFRMFCFAMLARHKRYLRISGHSFLPYLKPFARVFKKKVLFMKTIQRIGEPIPSFFLL